MSAQTFGWEPRGSLPTFTLDLESPHTESKQALSQIDELGVPLAADARSRVVGEAEKQCAENGRYLIVAALMVRNEAHTIAQTLASLRNFADALVLLDTGSTDNTIALANEFCNEKRWPASVFEQKFEPFDFSKARNRLLEHCGAVRDSEFIFLADAHDCVHNGFYLRTLCAVHLMHERGAARWSPTALGKPEWAKEKLATSAGEGRFCLENIKRSARAWSGDEQAMARKLLPCHYFMAVDFVAAHSTGDGDRTESLQTMRQPMVRLIRSGSGWRYSGPVHEVLWNDWWLFAQRIEIPAHRCKVVQDKRFDMAGSQDRWPRDLRAIDAFLQRHTAHPQALYYRGKTLRALGQQGEAVQALAARLRAVSADNDSAPFQRYNTHFMLADCLFVQAQSAIRCNRASKIDASVAQSIENHCWQAFAVRQRAEPLLLLAKLYCEQKQAWRMLSVMLLAMRVRESDIDASEAYQVAAYDAERRKLYEKALQLTNMQ